MKKILWRAFKTFAQAFLAVVVAAGTDYMNATVWQAAAVAGGAALLSFAYNFVTDWEPV